MIDENVYEEIRKLVMKVRGSGLEQGECLIGLTNMDLIRRQDVIDVLALEPCHVTGLHDPEHTTRRVCNIQRAVAWERLLSFLGVDEEDLPRRMKEDCYFCHEGEDKPILERWVEEGCFEKETS